MKVEPIVDAHGTEWQWQAFAEFVKLKAEVKEPSPHMQMIGPLTEGCRREEIVWFAGLYCAFYNIPSALVMWEEWPWERALEEPLLIGDWLQDNWQGTFTRIERRTVRTVAKMQESILSYIKWADQNLPFYLDMLGPFDNNLVYDNLWVEADANLRYMGRYIIIRLLEALYRFAGLKPKLYDIRSIGGWSPKRALGLLYPEHLPLLLSPDNKENIRKVDTLAFQTIDKFKREYGVPMTPYVFAAMLCEYRVAYENRHQYPSWTIDQEPAYWWKIQPFWENARGKEWANKIESHFFSVRRSLFPEKCLGELHDWKDTRLEPRRVLRDFGYNWSDLRYDYIATRKNGDWKNPVRW